MDRPNGLRRSRSVHGSHGHWSTVENRGPQPLFGRFGRRIATTHRRRPTTASPRCRQHSPPSAIIENGPKKLAHRLPPPVVPSSSSSYSPSTTTSPSRPSATDCSLLPSLCSSLQLLTSPTATISSKIQATSQGRARCLLPPWQPPPNQPELAGHRFSASRRSEKPPHAQAAINTTLSSLHHCPMPSSEVLLPAIILVSTSLAFAISTTTLCPAPPAIPLTTS